MELKKVVLHNTLHIGSHNLGLRLDPHLKKGLSLFYDRENQELTVRILKEYAIVPMTNVSYMVPKTPEDDLPPPKTPVKKVPASAQVDGPTHHVFAGEGKGKTNK